MMRTAARILGTIREMCSRSDQILNILFTNMASVLMLFAWVKGKSHKPCLQSPPCFKGIGLQLRCCEWCDPLGQCCCSEAGACLGKGQRMQCELKNYIIVLKKSKHIKAPLFCLPSCVFARPKNASPRSSGGGGRRIVGQNTFCLSGTHHPWSFI